MIKLAPFKIHMLEAPTHSKFSLCLDKKAFEEVTKTTKAVCKPSSSSGLVCTYQREWTRQTSIRLKIQVDTQRRWLSIANRGNL